MPVIHVYHPVVRLRTADILSRMCAQVADAAELPREKVWALWHPIEESMACRPGWDKAHGRAPIVRLFCRRSHSRERVARIVTALRASLAGAVDCSVDQVFVQVLRVEDDDVFGNS